MIIQKLKRLLSCSYQLGFRNLVAHQWTGSYLLKQYGHHYRKALRLLNKLITAVGNVWTGINVGGSPIVALAPPLDPLKYGTPKKLFLGDTGCHPS